MRQLFKFMVAAACALPLATMAATTYSTDHTVTGSETTYTTSAGNANVTWQNFNFRAAVDKDHMAHGYYFYLKDGDTDIGETDSAVKLDSITLTWGSSGTSAGIGLSDTPYLVVTTADDTPVILGVSAAGAPYTYNETSTFVFTDLVLASNAKYRFYFYKNDVTGLSVGATLTGATTGRVNGRYHNTSGDARADYNDICCNGGNGYSVNCSFVVSPVETTDVTVIETSNSAVTLAGGNSSLPVVIEGKVADGVVEVGSAANVAQVVTVDGEATTLELTDSLTATAFYFPAAVTIDASSLSGLDPTGGDVSKTTVLLSGALKYTTAPTVTLPAATAGMIYETNITASGISVTVVKGVDCVETISGNTSWSTIKPTGWMDAVVGDKPAIAITYEGEDPVTLTFDEAVQAGSLTLTGNIVVEASAAATFGAVTAGAGSVVEMANMTITTQSGTGVYRYRSNYPSTVPNNSLTYEYVGTDDSENPGTVNLNGMRGTVRTTGYMSITGYYPLLTNARLDVVSGTTTLTAGGQAICGYITIREGATLVNTATDSLAYSNYNSIIDIYGTLDMGTSRWTTWSGAAINLRGGEVVGVGEGNNGALDFMGTCNITAYADSTISANVKFRNALSNVTVNNGVTLTISGVTKPGYDGGGITKKGAGTLKFTSDPYVPGGIVVEAGTLAFDTESDVDPVVTYTAAVLKDANMDYVDASNWKGTVIVSAVAAGTTTTQVALNKTGNANSYLTLNGISGDAWCAGSNYTVQPAITLAGDVNFQNGSSNKAVTFRKIAAGTGNLSLKSWCGCSGVTYGFTTIDADNYTGTIQLDGSVLTFNVGNILKAGAGIGDKVLPLTVANNATVNVASAQLNGESVMLEVREGGLYVKDPSVAQIGDTKYETLAAALSEVEAGQTISLLKDIALTEAVTVGKSITIDGAYTISGSGMMLNLAAGKTLTLTGGLTVSCQIGFLGALDTKVVAATGVTIGVWRPNGFTGAPNEAQANTPSEGWTTYTVSAYTTVAITAGNSSVKDGDGEDVVGGYRTVGTTIEFYVTPNSGYTLVSVTVNGTPISADEFGKYSVVVGEESLQIVVNTEEASSDTYEITGETELGEGGTLDIGSATTIKIGTYDVTAGFSIDGTTATLLAPAVVEGETQKAVDVGATTVTLNVTLVPGLYYGVASGTEPTLSRPDTLTQYTDDDSFLTVDKPSAAKGFFKVFVDIKQ